LDEDVTLETELDITAGIEEEELLILDELRGWVVTIKELDMNELDKLELGIIKIELIDANGNTDEF
jgi:hypothetical protein